LIEQKGQPMMCVTTRFEVKHIWSLPRLYLAYRRMLPDLDQASGLIRHAFLLESPSACCTLSVWESRASIVAFSNTRSHIEAVRLAKRLCRAIWSTYWRLDATSRHATLWPGATAWPELVGQTRRASNLSATSEPQPIGY
jgi:hypothetical protein